MTARIALDTSAIIHFFRDLGPEPTAMRDAEDVVVPLPVVGELYAGAYGSANVALNVATTETFLERHRVLTPDVATARVYGKLRGRQRLAAGRVNDLWIAALCIQHDLPLLTRDRGFDGVTGLAVIHW